MTQRDISRHVNPAESVEPALYAADVDGSAVDLQGFDAAFALLHAGAITDGNHAPEFQHADDDGTGSPDAGTWETVPAADLVGAWAAIADNDVQVVGYRGTRRHLRVSVTVTGDPATGGIYGATIVRGLATHNAFA